MQLKFLENLTTYVVQPVDYGVYAGVTHGQPMATEIQHINEIPAEICLLTFEKVTFEN